MKDPVAYKEEFTRLCTACGLCAVMCPPFTHRSIPDSCQEIQKQVRGYLRGDPPANSVLERSQLCNECCKCVRDTCPQGLDPMRTNQMLRGFLHDQDIIPRPFIPPSDPGSHGRITAALLTTEEEYRRITTPAVKGDGRILFFAGCNIYYQPNLLLTALDVLDIIADGWTFLPGLDHCCGSNHDSAGRLDAGSKNLEKLASAMDGTGFETVVAWCSTCIVRFHLGGYDLPVISFARLINDRLGSDLLREPIGGGVTLQEPCKDAYLGLDTEAPRALLKKVAGEPVREMARHGKDTVCCSWALYQHQPKTCNEGLKERLAEAKATGAGTMATVCHGCQWIMDKPWIDSSIQVVNYINLVGEVLGISHRERFQEMRETGSPEAAIDFLREEMGDRYNQLPFDRDQIMGAVQILMEGFYGT